MSHTPGPWRYDRDQFTDEEGPVWLVEDVAGHNIILAKIPVLGGDDTHSERETEANANLIAAAPDLLEALEGCVIAFCDATCPAVWKTAEHDGRPHGPRCKANYAAIAKARGEE